MKSDWWMLWFLLNRARSSAPWRRALAYSFDGVNDYIAWDTTIGRTGYDMNVYWNVSVSSDSDGSYFWINWNRNATAWTWSRAEALWWATPTFTQATDFTIKARVKLISNAVSDSTWIFWSRFWFCISNPTGNFIRFTVRWSTTVDVNYASTLNTLYDLYLVWVAADAKFYYYVNWTLQNVWGTAWPATFTTVWSTWLVWDNAIGGGNPSSGNKYIYHACVRNKALSQAEVDADIALWNTTKSDPTIVAYYIPENLQYNTDYITTKDFSNASWTKTGTTITAGQTDPNWWTSAYELAVSAWAGNGVTITNNTVTWSSLASKTFIMKVFAKTTSWSATMRLRISHNGVATYYGSNQTVTTDYQQFTFTQALTSSTSGTWMTYWIEVWSGAWAATFIAYYPTDWLTNQTLRDNSPNIGGYIGWKTDKVFSCWCKPWADNADTPSAGTIMVWPWLYTHIRTSTNIIRTRYDNRIWAKESTYTLWNWFRNKVHIIWAFYWTGSVWATKLYVNGVLQDSDSFTIDAPSSIQNSWNYWNWRFSSAYFTWLIREPRIYTWTITDADALLIYQGWEPTTPGTTKYLQYKPQLGEIWTTAQDQTSNNRDGTLNWWVTRVFS